MSEDVDEISAKDDGTFTALQEKIDNAAEGSTITLENDYIYDGSGSTIDIYKSITINGNNHIIDGKNKISLFKVKKEVTFNDVNFYNGFSSMRGGAIDAGYEGGFLHINNCTFSDNTAKSGNSGDGGAIHAHEYLNVLNSKFINNYAGYSGGAISCSDAYFKNCSFINNAVMYAFGGAVYIYSNIEHDPIVDFYDSYFMNNVADWCAGAIYGSSYTNIFNCVFYDNVAARGGAISGAETISNSIFVNNTDNAIEYARNINSNIFINNTKGAISCYNSDCYIRNCTFINNDDAVRHNYNSESSNNGYVSISNSNFTTSRDNVINNVYLSIYDSTFNQANIYNDGRLYLQNNTMYRGSIFNYIGQWRGIINSFVYITILENSTKTLNIGEKINLTKIVTDDNNNQIFVKDFIFSVNGNPVNETYVPVKEGTYIVSVADFPDANDYFVKTGTMIVSGTNLDVPDVTKDYGGPEKLEITLTESDKPIANADVNININGRDYAKTTDTNGKTSLGLNLNAGNYDATVTYEDISTVAKVTINQLTTTNTLTYDKTSHNSVNLISTVNPSTANGNVVFTVNGKDYAADKISGGKATHTLSNLAVGSYEAKATYHGDVNHKSSVSASVKFTVEEVKYDVSAPDLTKYYHGPERFVVTVKEDNKPVVGKNVTINLNNVPYNRTTDANGQASMAINLNSGTYNVTSEYDGIKVKSTITVKPTIQGKDITKIYKNNTQYYATFVDTNGNLMKNTDITFNINGVFYTRKTNDQGVAKMNINLPPGTYIITAENPNSTERYTNVIKVLPSIVENYDLTKYYKNASKYTLRIIGDNGKPVGEGVTVKLNINGVFYERKTNASGYMNMNINLPPGTYTVTAEYNGLMASNKITVLSVLETHNLVMKYKDGSKFEAKVLDGQGKPYAGQTVTFNINGVFYTKTTEASGIARLNINLMPGEYIITSSYNGSNVANKITISS